MSKRISKIPKRAIDAPMRFSRTPIRGVRGIYEICVIHGSGIRSRQPVFLFFINLKMAGGLLLLELIAARHRKPKMSCRIDRVVSAESLVVLSVSGRITGEDVDMLRGVLQQESGGFAIDLKNVLLVAREAVKLLALSEAHGAELRNCPPYIREWVTREREGTKSRGSNKGSPRGEDIEDA
jgi:hypothetical protein